MKTTIAFTLAALAVSTQAIKIQSQISQEVAEDYSEIDIHRDDEAALRAIHIIDTDNDHLINSHELDSITTLFYLQGRIDFWDAIASYGLIRLNRDMLPATFDDLFTLYEQSSEEGAETLVNILQMTRDSFIEVAGLDVYD